METILLPTLSNLFMTFAGYGHLKFTKSPLMWVIWGSWGIVFFEDCLQVPANRMGAVTYKFAPAQLKVMQEAIKLVVFTGFSYSYLGQPLAWNHWLAFGLVFIAVAIAQL